MTPTLEVEVWKRTGSDVYGQPVQTKVRGEKVAPVRLEFSNQHTTVRTDSAASHGHAQETVADVVLLAVAATQIALDDMLVVLGHKVRVVKVHPRFTVAGKLDHNQIHCEAWV
jgi:hypothetical protein